MMKPTLAHFALGLISIFIVHACVHDPIIPEPQDDPIDTLSIDTSLSQSKGCSPDSVYFVNDIQPLLISNCAMNGCHSASSANNGVVLDSYLNIMSTADVRAGDLDGSDLYEVITETDEDKRMPPVGSNPLSAEQIDLVRTWILQGALNNECQETQDSITCDTSDYSLSGFLRPILQQKCEGCHNPNGANAGVDVQTYSELKKVVDNGKFLGAIKHLNGYKPMPQGQSKLDSCVIRKIELWINAGAPNN